MDRDELAGFLRTRRSRIQPADLGLDGGRRRQTPGLRREELARLAGISVDYYTRMEQARGPRPSRQVLTALARALRLSDDERAYLLRLLDEAPGRPDLSREVPASLLRLLDRLDGVPAMVINGAYDILAWNRMAVALVGDFSAVPERERNTLRWLFLSGRSWPRDDPEWDFARQCVAGLRASGRYPHDRAVRDLVDELSARSPEFGELWTAHEVAVPHTITKRTTHPVVGEIQLDCEILALPERDERLVFYTAAPGTASHDALFRLRDNLDERSGEAAATHRHTEAAT